MTCSRFVSGQHGIADRPEEPGRSRRVHQTLRPCRRDGPARKGARNGSPVGGSSARRRNASVEQSSCADIWRDVRIVCANVVRRRRPSRRRPPVSAPVSGRGGRFWRSGAAPSATAVHTACASALRFGEIAPGRAAHAAAPSPAARDAAPAARNAPPMSMSPYQANSGRRGAPGRQPSRAGRRPPTPAGSAAACRRAVRRSAIEKNAERNGSTREPSEVVPSGNRIRLSPPRERWRACHRARAR